MTETAPASSPDAPAPASLRGGPWPTQPPTYDRGEAGQAEFEQAVTRLWQSDSWVNPRTGQHELNADLVLEGGGVKGIGLVGAILVLAEAGYRFPRAAGTSAGAITAVLVAAIEKSGRDMTVLAGYLQDIDYSQFMHTGPVRHAVGRLGGPITGIYELMLHSGLYTGGYLNIWLGGKLAECGITTWSDLAISTEDDPGLSLPPGHRYRAVVHVSDITRGMLARLPWDYSDYYGLPADKQDVVAAVRASMSIPFFFEPVRTATAAAETPMPDGTMLPWPGGTVTWVDGGMLMNFPMSAFDRTDGQQPRWPTIGIKLSAEPGSQKPDVPVRGPLQEGIRCLETMTSEWDRYHVEQNTADRTIFVANAGITATEFDLSPARQQALFLNGAQAATAFLTRWAAAGGVPRGTCQPAAA